MSTDLPIPAIPFLANLDIRQNQIKNVVIDKLSQEPSSPVVGQTYYNTTDNKVYTYNGTTWDILTNESEILYIPYKNEYTTDDYNKYYPKIVSAIQNNNIIFLKQDNPYAIYFIPLHTFAQSETNNLTLVFAITEASSIELVNKAYIGKFNMLFDTTYNSITTETTSFELVLTEEGKGLSTNDYTNEDKQAVQDNTTARHTHSNKMLLDTYDQTNANISDAVTKKHTHNNKSILDSITASYTTEEQTKLGGIEAGAQVNTVASVNSKTGAVTLTASDVGALPADTTIPTKTSDLQNDSGFITAAPVDSVNGKTGAVVLNANDVGALPSTTAIPTKTSDLTNDSNFISSNIVTAFWQGTQSEYDALENKDTTTLYMIIEG